MNNLEFYSAPANTGSTPESTPTADSGFSFDFNNIPTLGGAKASDTAPVTDTTRIETFEEKYGDRPKHLVERQLELEEEAIEFSKKRYYASLETRNVLNLTTSVSLVKRGFESVRNAIQAWMDAPDDCGGRNIGVRKFVRQFDADELAILSLRAAVSATVEGGANFTAVAKALVGTIEDVDLEARLEAHDPFMAQRYRAMAKRRQNPSAILREQGAYTGVFDASSTFKWTDKERLVVGAELLQIVIEQTEIVEKRTVMDNSKARVYSRTILGATPQTQAWIEDAHKQMAVLRPTLFPMVVAPRDWTSDKAGGYLSQKGGHKHNFVKQSFKQTKQARSKGSKQAYAAINALQNTEWRINSRVLANVGRPTRSDFAMPTRHPFMDRDAATWTEEERIAFKAWKKECVILNRVIDAEVSKNLTITTQIEIAEKMQRFDALYFPHNVDFRGRAYPLPGYVNPQGNDLGKALLEFAKAVPLGEYGAKWLAVHGANTFGEKDKAPFEERIGWVMENEVAILADARDPKRGGALWKDADSPYQFLAFCFEWADLRQWAEDGNDVYEFQSRLAVGMDGSCNGLQHFSAMLRDSVGGTATNLTTSERPSDIYALVAKEVSRSIERDLMDDEKASFAAFWMSKGITRKLTKRNTMTLPYGVTKRGMMDQLWDELGGTQGAVKYVGNFDEVGPKKLVSYLANKNWDGTGVVVKAAREAMDFTKACAKVCNAAKVTLKWSVLDGMALTQDYAVMEKVSMRLHGHELRVTFRTATEKTSSAKQSLGIAPNFVHSVDACHMRMTINALVEAGVTDFAMIHDSYGTHAGNVELMQQVTREQFVKLHSEPLLENFRNEVLAALPEKFHKDVPAVPASGSLNLKAVLNSPYFFA